MTAHGGAADERGSRPPPPWRKRGWGGVPGSALGATDSSPGTRQHGARAWLPSPLAGEGLGERGVSAKASAFPPLPNPSPARGEGLKARLSSRTDRLAWRITPDLTGNR